MNKTDIMLSWLLTSLFIIAGIVILNWPQRAYHVNLTQSSTASKPTELKTNSEILQSFSKRFDHAALPKQVIPQKSAPIIDPAADLKRWTLIGIVQSDQKAMALFSKGNLSTVREAGNELAGFTITKITPREVLFQNETLTHSLRLPHLEPRKISLNQGQP